MPTEGAVAPVQRTLATNRDSSWDIRQTRATESIYTRALFLETAVREGESKSRVFAAELRARLTDAEKILWSRLRLARQVGIRFRRQHPVGPYIADFACCRAHLVIELDGATHGSDEELARDRRRDAYMRARGWRVLRFSKEDIYRHLEDVVSRIFADVPPPPRTSCEAPPPQAGEAT